MADCRLGVIDRYRRFTRAVTGFSPTVVEAVIYQAVVAVLRIDAAASALRRGVCDVRMRSVFRHLLSLAQSVDWRNYTRIPARLAG